MFCDNVQIDYLIDVVVIVHVALCNGSGLAVGSRIDSLTVFSQ